MTRVSRNSITRPVKMALRAPALRASASRTVALRSLALRTLALCAPARAFGVRALVGLVGLVGLGGLGGCSPAQTPTDSLSQQGGGAAKSAEYVAKDSAIHPISGLQIIPLSVISGGKTHRFSVELAASAQEQSKGLMFRRELGADEGMIFPRNPADIASFWMKNTPLPLDIIFVAPDGKIINIAAKTVPYSRESVQAEGLTGLVLELAGGRAEALGITAGDRVEYRLPASSQ